MLSALLFTWLLGALINVEVAGVCSADGPKFGEAPLSDVLENMTLEEKVTLLVGIGMDTDDTPLAPGDNGGIVPGAAGTTSEIPRLCIPPVVLADGPAGLRIASKRIGSTQTYYCTEFPIGTLLASTWNRDMLQQVGMAMGNEVLEYGVDVLLGPAINIQRNPLCGRDAEYYSEDPVLSGELAAAMIKGIQYNGVGASVKHYVAYNQETNRHGSNALVSERALREIYLRNFEIAVKKGDPWTIMSSYNHLNDVFTSESRPLITDVLRGEWKFDGIVMTDWYGGNNAPAQVHAGNDLLMPGRDVQKKAIIEAIHNNTLSMTDLDTNVERILKFILKTPRFKGYKYSNKPDLDAHAKVSRDAAADGMVLLKNENALPLPSSTKNVAAFGVSSYDTIGGGSGSADVNKTHMVMLSDALQSAGYTVDKELADKYATYIAEEKANLPIDPDPRMKQLRHPRAPELVPNYVLLSTKAKDNDVAIVTLGRNSGEFRDRTIKDFSLYPEELELVQVVTKAFRNEQKSTIVVLNIGEVIETASWKNLPDAILLAWQNGQEGGHAIADTLKGTVNPSGKLPVTFPIRYMDGSSATNFPFDHVQTPEEAIRDLSVKNGRDLKNDTRNIDYTVYEEGVFVGYRYQQTNNILASYPFGYGLSYTDFDYYNETISQENGVYSISVWVQNVGKVPGKEVLQVYVVPSLEASASRPARELKAFTKTRLLQPGDVEEVKFDIPLEALAFYDERERAWVVEQGRYLLQLGSSSEDVKKNFFLQTNGTRVTESTPKPTLPDDATKATTGPPQSTSGATTHLGNAVTCWSALFVLVSLTLATC